MVLLCKDTSTQHGSIFINFIFLYIFVQAEHKEGDYVAENDKTTKNDTGQHLQFVQCFSRDFAIFITFYSELVPCFFWQMILFRWNCGRAQGGRGCCQDKKTKRQKDEMTKRKNINRQKDKR